MLYKYNPDTSKVHFIAGKTPSCNFPIMDNDETNFRADSNTEAIQIAKRRFSKNASKCMHCM